MIKILLITSILTAFSLSAVHGLCCPWVLSQDVKCQCADGSLVHPWDCCSTDTCNVFCCNCGGPCKGSNNTKPKRDVEDLPWKTAIYFANVDVDGDMRIGLDEASDYIGRSKPDHGQQQQGGKLDWFKRIDVDRDGWIQPNEFDEDLDQETVSLARQRLEKKKTLTST